MANNPRSHA